MIMSHSNLNIWYTIYIFYNFKIQVKISKQFSDESPFLLYFSINDRDFSVKLKLVISLFVSNSEIATLDCTVSKIGLW